MTRPTCEPLRIISPIHRTLRRLGTHLDARSRELGLRGQDAHLLAYLTFYGPCTVSRLGEVFGHKPSTLTSMLDRLESDGYLVRRPNPDDRRSFRVDTTAAGTELGRRSRRVAEGCEAEILARITADDLAGFDRVLAAVEAAIAARAEKPSPLERKDP